MARPLTGTCMAAVLAALAGVAPAHAQAVRVNGATTMRYIEIRPFVRDSVPADATDGTGLLRLAPDGRVVRCVPGVAFCEDVRPGERVSTMPVIHDIEASAWGLGTGIRVFTHVRARTGLSGDDSLWPRGDDAFDVVAAYGELERARLRLRVGRQWQVSGLGFYNFDGVALALRPLPRLSIEAYGGRSLLRGLNEARTGGALEAIEPLGGESAGMLLGVHARYRPHARLALATGYHVEFRTDGGGLYSELAVADAMLQLGAGSITGALEVDVAGANLNEARLRYSTPPLGAVTLHGDVRRYRPYFELWTIWGAFSPVGFDEVRGSAAWVPKAELLVRAEASYRSYGDFNDYDGLAALRTDGWGVGTSVSWMPAPAWHVDAAYRVEVGAGAARREAQLVALRRFGDVATVSAQGIVFQRLYEFRLDESTVAGAGAEASLRLSARARVFASATAYRHLDRADMPAMDWTQRRALLRLQWTVGAEPGTGAGAAGGP